MARKVTVELTEAQLHAVVRLAECAANTWDDAISVLVEPSTVQAAYRGIAAMNAVLYPVSR